MNLKGAVFQSFSATPITLVGRRPETRGGGGGSTQQSFLREFSAPRYINPLDGNNMAVRRVYFFKKNIIDP